MGARIDHHSFQQPDDCDAALWRYMDVPKLLSLLTKRALYLSRLVDLDDPCEGSATLKQYWRSLDVVKQLADSGKKTVGRRHSSTELVRADCYVSCWCLQHGESNALWRIYGQGPYGVAVRTTYRQLAAALTPLDHLGQVRYIDYGLDDFSTQNRFNYAIHKRHEYEYEHEVRSVRWNVPPTVDAEGPCIEAYQKTVKFVRGQVIVGLATPVDPEGLVNAIVVSPYAPLWCVEVLQDAVKGLGYEIRVEDSDMRRKPLTEVHYVTEEENRILNELCSKHPPLPQVRTDNIVIVPEE